MTKVLSLIVIVMVVIVAFMGVRIEALTEQSDTAIADITQLRTDTEDKLKSTSTTIDGLTARVTALEQSQQHAAVPAPGNITVTPPIIASQPITGPGPHTESAPAPAPQSTPIIVPAPQPAAPTSPVPAAAPAAQP